MNDVLIQTKKKAHTCNICTIHAGITLRGARIMLNRAIAYRNTSEHELVPASVNERRNKRCESKVTKMSGLKSGREGKTAQSIDRKRTWTVRKRFTHRERNANRQLVPPHHIHPKRDDRHQNGRRRPQCGEQGGVHSGYTPNKNSNNGQYWDI